PPHRDPRRAGRGRRRLALSHRASRGGRRDRPLRSVAHMAGVGRARARAVRSALSARSSARRLLAFMRVAERRQGILGAMTSWRTAAVTLLSFSSGLPLGLVWLAIPDWLRSIGVDIRVVGLLTLAQAPWSFKVLWAPLMDRYTPPFFG